MEIQSALPAVIPTGLFIADRNGSAQTSMTGGAANKLNLTHEVVDARGWYDTGTYRYTPLVSGYYQFHVSATSSYAAASDMIEAFIYKNGAIAASGIYTDGLSDFSLSIASAVLAMNGTTDYVEAYAYLPATATSVSGAVDATYMNGYKVADL